MWWWGYKSKRRTRMEIHEFLLGLFEYKARLGAWQRTGRAELHRAYCHIAKGQVKQTCKLVGGSPIPVHWREAYVASRAYENCRP